MNRFAYFRIFNQTGNGFLTIQRLATYLHHRHIRIIKGFHINDSSPVNFLCNLKNIIYNNWFILLFTC